MLVFFINELNKNFACEFLSRQQKPGQESYSGCHSGVAVPWHSWTSLGLGLCGLGSLEGSVYGAFK